jgi:hypothetical protein
VDGDEKGGKGLKDSSLEMAFAELAFSILLKLSYEKLSCEKMRRGLIVRNKLYVEDTRN